MTSARIYIALYDEYLMLFPSAKPTIKVLDYIRIRYDAITAYTFLSDCTYDSDDSSNLFPHYKGYGRLLISTDGSNYKTQIADIAEARTWLTKFVAIPETPEKRM